MQNKTYIMVWGAIIFIVALVVGAYLFLWKGNDFYTDQNPQARQPLQEVILPEGVSVAEENGDKKIINNIDNYSLTLESNVKSIQYKNGLLEVTNNTLQDNKLDYSEYYNISLLDLGDSSLEDWIKFWISQQEYSEDYSYEKQNTNNKEFYIIYVPSYSDSEKNLVYKYDNKAVFVSSIFGDPIEIFNNMTLK